MRDRRLDRLFDRFRRRGDVQALGEVFDRTAGELLRVALRLVGDPDQADDLLQQTYLTAIERRESYDASRRLLPWLLGILVQHAREERRRRRRVLVPEDVERSVPRGPEALALDGEFAHELKRALAELSEEDRSVLEAHLLAEQGAVDIARARGLAPGAVRMRIHRGLERLRKALPAGLAAGGAAGAAHGHGLAAVRAAVLRSGEGLARGLAKGVTLGAGSAVGTGILGGVMLGKKLVLALVLAIFAAGLYLLDGGVTQDRGDDSAEVVRAGTLEEPDRANSPALLSPAVPEPLSVSPRRASLPGGERAPGTSAHDPDRAGLRGRLVEASGLPVPGVPMTLLEVGEARFFPGPHSITDPAVGPRLVVASGVTDQEGYFALQGAETRALHGLGIDLGGQRSGLRLLGAVLSPGETTDLGDVVLVPSGRLSGTVVDEDGEPLAGVRVRAGPLSQFVIGLGIHHLPPGGAITELRRTGNPDFVMEFPEWLSRLESKLPLVTTTTAVDGSYALPHASAGATIVLFDAPGYVRGHAGPLDLGEGVSLEVEEFELLRGAELDVQVVDSDGAPVPLAQVRAGFLVPGMGVAMLGALVRADGAGRVRAAHLPDELQSTAIARRDAFSPWAVGQAEGASFLIELHAESELQVDVLDSLGQPVLEPELLLRPGTSMPAMAWVLAPLARREARPVEGYPGRWSLGKLAHGPYLLAARATGLAPAEVQLVISPGSTRIPELVLATTHALEVRVRDASGAPVPRAAVRVEREGGGPRTTLFQGTTDRDGKAALRRPEQGAKLFLHVQHAHFAPNVRPLEGVQPSHEVVLSAGGRLLATLADPELRRFPTMLVLSGASASGSELPLLRAMPSEGSLELERLAPGKWSWTLIDSMAGSEALSFLDPTHLPAQHLSGSFILEEGQTYELALGGRSETGPGAAEATVTGVVRVRDRRAGELQVNLIEIGGGAESQFMRSSSGRFRFEHVLPGKYFLHVSEFSFQGNRNSSTTLVQEQIEVAPGEALDLEYEVEVHALVVTVSSESGRALGEVSVRIVGSEQGSGPANSTTDGKGRAQLAAVGGGHFRVLASHPEEGAAEGEIVLGAGEPAELALTLSKGIECAGTLRLAAALDSTDPDVWLMVQAKGDSLRATRRKVEFQGDIAPFQLIGLQPGPYRAHLWIDGQSYSASFELPEWGSSSLNLELELPVSTTVIETR